LLLCKKADDWKLHYLAWFTYEIFSSPELNLFDTSWAAAVDEDDDFFVLEYTNSLKLTLMPVNGQTEEHYFEN